jgi:type VI secretion system protein VasI
MGKKILIGFLALVAIGMLADLGSEAAPSSSNRTQESSVAPIPPQAPADPVASAEPAEPAPPSPPPSAWLVSNDVSEFDDTKSVYLTVSSEDMVPNRYGGYERPTFTLRCMEGTTAAVVDWSLYLGIGDTRIEYRLDDAPVQTRTWNISNNSEAVGLWRGGTSIPFIRSLEGKERILFRVVPYGENAVTATFDIRGLDQHLDQLRQACNW